MELGTAGWPLHPGDPGAAKAHCRGRLLGSRGQGCTEARWLCPRCPSCGRGHLGAGRVTAVQSRVWGCVPRSPGGQDPARVFQRAPRPSEPPSGPRGALCPPRPASLPVSVTAPVWDSNQAVMERRGRDPETRSRGNSGRWTHPCAGCRSSNPPASPRSWRAPRAPGDAGCRPVGDIEGVDVPEGVQGDGWELGGERRGRTPRGQTQGVLMPVLAQRFWPRLPARDQRGDKNGTRDWGRPFRGQTPPWPLILS